MLTLMNHSTDPFYNLALEEYIFNTFTEGEIFFLWRNSPCVIVGSYQNICREVNVLFLEESKIPVLRRISGGGSVYHDLGNINYTYIADRGGAVDYDRFLQPMIHALNRISVKAVKHNTSDIFIGDKKISGNAQRSGEHRVLHHGTLLYKAELEMLDKITSRYKNESFCSTATVSNVSSVVNISEHLRAGISVDDFISILNNEVLGGNFGYLELSTEDRRKIEDIRKEKYMSWEWTWGRTPPFIYNKKGDFMGAHIEVGYKAKKGIISEVKIDSARIDGRKLEFLMKGARLDPCLIIGICKEIEPIYYRELASYLI